jgi:hypothetical protein
MLSEMQDRDAIVSNAIEIASPAVRQAYIAGACGNDAVLRRQIEERVAAHFAAASRPRSSKREMEHSSTNQVNHVENGEAPGRKTCDLEHDLTKEPMEAKEMGQKKPRGLMTVWALLLLPATVGGAGLTVWKVRADDPEQPSVQQLREERDRARKAEEDAKKQLEKAVVERQALEKERDQALAAEKAARSSEQNIKAVLAFLQDKLLLSTGNPSSWSGDGLGKDVTLRKAVDAAEAKVSAVFADRPLVEASIRETLGATYLELGDSKRSIQQYQRALTLLEGELGPDHPDTGECRNQLAIALRRAGRHDDASRLFDLNMQNNKDRNLKRKQNPARG